MTVRRTVAAAATLVAVATFVLLYYGLVDLARVAGITDVRAWLYPLAIDGMVAAGYASTLVLRRGHLAYAWAVVGIGSGLSLLGQWLHAEQTSSWSYAGPVAAAPALSMALVWHLLFLVTTKRDEGAQEELEIGTAMHELAELYAVADPEVPTSAQAWDAVESPVRDLVAARSAVVSASVSEGPVTVRDTDRLELAVSALRSALDRGETLTGAAMAEALELHNAGTEAGRRNGLRWLRKAQEALSAPA